ncbi:MAG: tetratricopeptide repeat protein [Gammaproteobacteria bacterium]
MSSNVSDCWKTAYELYVAGKEEDAIKICEQEPCASQSMQCQRFLGWTYFERYNWDRALFWFSRASSQGDAESIYGIAATYLEKKDFVRAIPYFEQAIACGRFRSYHWLGLMYENGLGVEKNIPLALDYYRKGAARGYLRAARALNRVAFEYALPFQKIILIANRIYMYAIAAFIASRNIKDERLADIQKGPKAR